MSTWVEQLFYVVVLVGVVGGSVQWFVKNHYDTPYRKKTEEYQLEISKLQRTIVQLQARQLSRDEEAALLLHEILGKMDDIHQDIQKG